MVTGVPTGFRGLDSLTSGLQKQDLVVIAARPSMGKTSLALTLAQHAAIEGNAVVGIFSLEMSSESLAMRMLCSEASVDAQKFRSGYLSNEEWSRLGKALGRLADARIFIDDTPAISVLEMRAKARRLATEQKQLDMIVVDYLQLMSGSSGRFESRQQEVSQISRELKALAKELNIPMVALSQLSRAPENRTDHRPQLADLRESGAIEQDADVVAFIYREEQYNKAEENREHRGTHCRQATQRSDRHGLSRLPESIRQIRRSRSRCARRLPQSLRSVEGLAADQSWRWWILVVIRRLRRLRRLKRQA